MTRHLRSRPVRVGLIFLTAVAAVLALTLGAMSAPKQAALTDLPCNSGGKGCLHIGFTNAWLDGGTVDLEYSHPFFCQQPPESGASSGCEAGEAAVTSPPNLVVSELYLLMPVGFTPPTDTVMCQTKCIDLPTNMDLSRIGGSDSATLGPKSFVIEEDESFQSTWWPITVVPVLTLKAWNNIANAKTIDAVDTCQANGGCAPEAETNGFAFFQVLGPGMSPTGPA